MAHVFISYAHADADFASALIYQLNNADLPAWIDSEQLRAGKDWRTGIDQAIEDSIALIVIVTPEAKSSEYVTYEWAYALGSKKTVIPILLKSTGMHPRLEVLQYLDFREFNNRPWEKLLRYLQEIKGEQDTAQPTSNIQSPLINYENAAHIQRLMLALNDPNHSTRQAAAASLGQFKDLSAVHTLIGVLKDRKHIVRAAAAKSLGQIGTRTALPALLEALSDKDYEVREAAAKSLGQLGDASAVPALSGALRDNDKWVRAAATRALVQIGTPEAQAAIEEWEASE